MRWFQGGIAEAVAASKARNAIFVVFVEGKDGASINAAATMDNVAVSSKLESDEFVVIKLDSGSEAYKQFVQIYQLVPVPSMFFIGGNGVPLEVVAGEVTVPELLQKITSVLEKSGKVVSPTEAESEAAATGMQDTKQNSPKIIPDRAGCMVEGASTSKEEVMQVTKASESQTQVAAPAVKETLNAEEKLERAKQLVEKKRKEKEEEEKQTQQQKEVERRKMGHEVQKLRRWQQDQELKHLKEDRQKEKAAEAAARERILRQIAEDRAERASRYSAEQEAAKKQAEEELQKRSEEEFRKRSEEQAARAAAQYNMARIQFRLPDGSSHSHNFEVTATLGEVRSYAATHLRFPFREFAMSTTFPRREFTSNHDGQTLGDLHLVPSAVMLILPASGRAITSSQSYNWSHLLWSFLAPLFSVLNYLRTLVFGGGGSSSSVGGSSISRGRNTQQSSSSSRPASTQNPTGARRRTPSDQTSVIRREGNIHRLTDRHDPDDDENNTWNGNSTQQM